MGEQRKIDVERMTIMTGIPSSVIVEKLGIQMPKNPILEELEDVSKLTFERVWEIYKSLFDSGSVEVRARAAELAVKFCIDKLHDVRNMNLRLAWEIHSLMNWNKEVVALSNEVIEIICSRELSDTYLVLDLNELMLIYRCVSYRSMAIKKIEAIFIDEMNSPDISIDRLWQIHSEWRLRSPLLKTESEKRIVGYYIEKLDNPNTTFPEMQKIFAQIDSDRAKSLSLENLLLVKDRVEEKMNEWISNYLNRDDLNIWVILDISNLNILNGSNRVKIGKKVNELGHKALDEYDQNPIPLRDLPRLYRSPFADDELITRIILKLAQFFVIG